MKLTAKISLILLTVSFPVTHQITCSNKQISDCVKCKSSSTECEICIEGRHGTTCALCQSNCQDCKDGENCENCKPNFFKETNSDGKQICTPCAPECYDCENASICRSCKEGYYQSATDATCKKCNEVCETCSTGIVCDTCKTGYYIDFSVTTACRLCGVEGCEACDSDDKCTRCKESWFLYEGKCFDIENWNKFLGIFSLSWGLFYFLLN